jgi:nucleotide-binding universal stress UspA family protein
MKILVAVDGSSYSRAAARYVAAHAKLLKKKPGVHLIHVHVPLAYSGAAAGVVGRDTIRSYLQDESEKALAVAARELGKRRMKYRAHWSVGEPAARIVAYARKERVDLIVTGSHGHGALANLALGSVATKIIALSKIPVLVVPRG